MIVTFFFIYKRCLGFDLNFKIVTKLFVVTTYFVI